MKAFKKWWAKITNKNQKSVIENLFGDEVQIRKNIAECHRIVAEIKLQENYMKAFEEWWLMEAQNIVGVGRCTEQEAAEAGYRAALEEVLKRVDSISESETIQIKLRQQTINWIKKELRMPKCATCDDTKQVGKEIIHKGRSMGWKECPDCVGKEIGD